MDLWVATEDRTIRQLLYIATDVCVVVYDPTQPETISNLRDVWIPEMLEHLPVAAWLFVPVCMEDKKIFQETSMMANEVISDSTHPDEFTCDPCQLCFDLFYFIFRFIFYFR